MNDAPVVVRQIVWRDVFPWLMLLRVFRVAIAPGPLLLSTIAVILCSLSWWVCGFSLLEEKEFAQEQRPVLLTRPYGMLKVPLTQAPLLHAPVPVVRMVPADEPALAYWDLTDPVRRLFDSRTPFRRVVYYFAGSLISIAVWAFVGGVISRQALVALGCEQPYDWFEAVGFVLKRYPQYLMAPIAPLLGLTCLGLLVLPLGWLMNLDIGLFIAGLAWIFVVMLGLVAAWLIVGLLFGWPLMFGAIGSKRDGDALQAFSDSYSYVYGKPLHYLFYVLVALTLGGLTLFVVDLFVNTATEFGFWATSWGAGGRRIEMLRAELAIVASGEEIKMLDAEGREIEIGMMHRSGVWLISVVLTFLQVIKVAAIYSYFFVSAAGIFLLMRLAVDDKEMDEVHLEDEEEHVETARRAMLSDDAPPAPAPPKPAPLPLVAETPASEPMTANPAVPLAFDTATPTEVPPPIVSTEITTPPDEPSEKPPPPAE